MESPEGDITYGVLWVSHGVEWTELHGEFVDDEVIGVVFRFDDSSKPLLIFCAANDMLVLYKTNITTKQLTQYHLALLLAHRPPQGD